MSARSTRGPSVEVLSDEVLNMGLLNLVFGCIGRCVDAVVLLLDVNFVVVHSLVRLLVALVSLLASLPTLVANSVLEGLNLTVLCAVALMDGATVVSHNVVGGGVQMMGGVLESFKMVGYLSSHILLRAKELVHRGLLSGHHLLRQAWEGCGIVLSLLLYLVNTVINLLLIGTQNLYGVVMGVAEAVSSPLQKAVELTLAVFTFCYSALVGTSVLLWTPCRLAMDFLSSLGHIFISVFLLNSYGLLLTLAIIISATVYLNPALSQQAVRRITDYVNTAPSLRRLRRTLQRLCVLERSSWQRLAWPRSRMGLWMSFGGRGAVRTENEDIQQPDTEDEAPPDDVAEGEAPPDDVAGTADVGGDGSSHQPPALHLQPFPDSSSHRPLQKTASEPGRRPPPADNLLSLLHEQEERKKCVICQDSTKTVVLLPCRHLCLCRDCTNILLRQPIYLHNCPLCRHMILQTMDVYL
ncbi:E3 ubiquitin-protein ligase RNF26 [Brachyhypopomus gauderio]|uniref:E3 ubiquitin-protein ligase RNF26 n=1 Tax=Brachyhypopomus gauderio TaxID=698409 RepID=UPI0040410FA1